jgi:predicted transcriptional regulator
MMRALLTVPKLCSRRDISRLTDEERAAIRKGMEAARRGEFATDEELAALYRRHGG